LDYSLIILVGKLTRDPELKYSASGGVPCATLALAVNRSQPQSEGTVQKSVSFVDVTVWRRLAEICCQFLRKGSCAMVIGKLHQQRSTGDGDRTGSHLQVTADSVQLLDRRVEPSEKA